MKRWKLRALQYLNVDWTRYDMANEHVTQPFFPISSTHHNGRIPSPIAHQTSQLHPESPLSSSISATSKRAFGDENIGLSVEIEAGEGKDEEVQVVLEGDDPGREAVEDHDALVV